MARVTVEDCIDKVPNWFELVLLAAHRAPSLASGSHITMDAENDKNGVIALREIAAKTIAPNDVSGGLIHSMQHNAEVKSPSRRRFRPSRASTVRRLCATIGSPIP